MEWQPFDRFTPEGPHDPKKKKKKKSSQTALDLPIHSQSLFGNRFTRQRQGAQVAGHHS